MRSRSRGERGSTLPLIAGALGLAIAVSVAVSSATSLMIERHRLVALAEAAALHGANSFDPALLRPGPGELIVPLQSSRVRQSVGQFLGSLPEENHYQLRLVAADTPDGRAARVVLQSTWQAPLVSQWLPASLPIRAEAQSRAVIR